MLKPVKIPILSIKSSAKYFIHARKWNHYKTQILVFQVVGNFIFRGSHFLLRGKNVEGWLYLGCTFLRGGVPPQAKTQNYVCAEKMSGLSPPGGGRPPGQTLAPIERPFCPRLTPPAGFSVAPGSLPGGAPSVFCCPQFTQFFYHFSKQIHKISRA